MQSTASTPDEYLASLPEDRREVMARLRAVIIENLPPGFEECMSYGMIGFAVPHSLYPAGYHCDPKQPLPFISLASQKNYVSVYHMGLMGGPLLDWFVAQWPLETKRKLDMGKSCIRIKKMDDIPYRLFGELASKITPEAWIASYERHIGRK